MDDAATSVLVTAPRGPGSASVRPSSGGRTRTRIVATESCRVVPNRGHGLTAVLVARSLLRRCVKHWLQVPPMTRKTSSVSCGEDERLHRVRLRFGSAARAGL